MSTDVMSNNSKIAEECDKKIRTYLTVTKNPTIAKFFTSNYEFIEANTPAGANVIDFWTERFENLSKIMNITVVTYNSFILF
ncbi:hypothetical protein BDC45DRAFT_568623 [Circinella umbellata]|nr:hypothetical protein BDC45DRAFT_568623 [Circinella umbellata]